MSERIRVLVVEDEPIAQQAHASYLRRVEGFELAGVAGDAATAMQALRAAAAHRSPDDRIDLILLDLNLPDAHGLELCRRIRTAGIDVDVIAITAARDLRIVRAAVSAGVVQYLIKPFAFPAFADKLEAYRSFRHTMSAEGSVASQHEVDLTLATLRAPSSRPQLAKGLSEDTLRLVSDLLRQAAGPLSASEAAAAGSLSRVTARRYLEYLAETGAVERSPRYGTPGRPELEYRWR